MSKPHPSDPYDVVVIGGAFCGAGFALLLRRLWPQSRVLLVEGRERFDRKVGESTVEVAGCFLHKVLGLHDLLRREHLGKQGLRYWFTDNGGRTLGEMSEVGPREPPPVPTFQLDRSKLDEQLLALAVLEGSELERPGRVVKVDPGWPESRVEVESGSGRRQLRTRWIIDASGRQAYLARRNRLLRPSPQHPTASAWARWSGVADLDGAAFLDRDSPHPALPRVEAQRRLATNHFCGYGWWCWVIPLKGGATSVGVVWNKELFDLPGTGSLRQRYEAFVTHQPGLRELLAGARIDGPDFMAYGHLPYRTCRYMDRGWALVGDAASFLDPYLSSGLDHASLSIYRTARLVARELAGGLDEDALTAAIATHNDEFLRSYDRWLEALYLGKYELMGDAELLGCSFLVDSACYYLGVVTPVYRNAEALLEPYFGMTHLVGRLSYWLVRGFKQRLIYLARLRRRLGIYGRRNTGWRLLLKPFGLGHEALVPLLRGLRVWLRIEIESLAHVIRQGP